MSLSAKKLLRSLHADTRPHLTEETAESRKVLASAKRELSGAKEARKELIDDLKNQIRRYKASVKQIDKDLDRIPEDQWGETIVGDIEDYRDHIDDYADAFEQALAQLESI